VSVPVYKYIVTSQGWVVQKVDSAIHQIYHYPAYTFSVVCFINTYPLDSDLSGGYIVIQPLNNQGQVSKPVADQNLGMFDA